MEDLYRFRSLSGPFLSLAALAILIDKAVPEFALAGGTACLGYLLTKAWKQKGLLISALMSSLALYFTLRSGANPLWSVVFYTSLFLSWAIALLADKEDASALSEKGEKIAALESAHAAAIQENRRALEHKERTIIQLQSDQKELLSRCNAMAVQERALQTSESEKKALYEKCSAYASTVEQKEQALESSEQQRKAMGAALEQKEQAILQITSEKAQLEQMCASLSAQVQQLKDVSPVSSIVPFEETNTKEQSQLEQLQLQHATLREQFEEKSAILDQTRHDLFKVESEYLAAQRAWDEQNMQLSEEESDFIRDLKAVEEERVELERQVLALQDLISSLLVPKKRAAVKKNKAKSKTALPDLLQEKIDQTIPTDS